MCPDCGSLHLRVESRDYGRDRETGYDDAGEWFVCLGCGERGPVEEVIAVAEEFPPSAGGELVPVARIAPAMSARIGEAEEREAA